MREKPEPPPAVPSMRSLLIFSEFFLRSLFATADATNAPSALSFAHSIVDKADEGDAATYALLARAQRELKSNVLELLKNTVMPAGVYASALSVRAAPARKRARP